MSESLSVSAAPAPLGLRCLRDAAAVAESNDRLFIIVIIIIIRSQTRLPFVLHCRVQFFPLEVQADGKSAFSNTSAPLSDLCLYDKGAATTL